MESMFLKIWKSWVDGGSIMIPLALVAVALYAGGLNLLAYLKRRRFTPSSEAQMREWVAHPEKAEGEVGEIIRYTQDGVRSLNDVSKRFEEVIAAKIPEVDRRLVFLNVLVAAAPLLGLLGTVMGMLVTFKAIAQGGGKTVDAMADGISQALITTEMGLLIALPGMFLAYQIRRRRNEYVGFLASLESISLRHFRRQFRFRGMTRVFTRSDFKDKAPAPVAASTSPSQVNTGLTHP
ncbi:MAG: MotA/TolQ/ExbB proton channel family protein [Verrucomicrobia bacterium]|nr:MotA/TolQ/ExbB proton channel family protein [Verrucomicrobiota bacterium]